LKLPALITVVNVLQGRLASALGIEAKILFLPCILAKKDCSEKARPRPVFCRGNALYN